MLAMCSKKRQVGGMVTVELAVILPGLILLLVWLVFFMFFLLDMAIVKSEVIRLSDEAAMLGNKDGNPETGVYPQSLLKDRAGAWTTLGYEGVSEERVSSRLKERLNERLTLTRCSETSVHIGSQKITVSGSLRFRSPLSGIGYAPSYGFQFKGDGQAPVNNWEEWLRVLAAMKADS
ncbi:MAG: hypothetical protein IJ137_02065 [Eubacterium sp.]|nr:hypothetical protein [Eubacterium sp.]